MLTFFVRLFFFLVLARVAFVVLRAVGLVAPRPPVRRPPDAPPGERGDSREPGVAEGAPHSHGSASTLGDDIVDAEFEDLPSPGER